MKQIIVIKFGGSLTKIASAKKKFLNEVALLSKRDNIVLVHGGGPEINYWLNRLNIKSRFVHGLRFTDAPTLEIVEMVLSGKVNKSLVADLIKKGVNAVGISGKDGRMVLCKRIKKLGFVGDPKKVNTALLKTLIKEGFLPVVSSLSLDQKGQTLNVNADSLATALAIGLRAERLVLLTDVPGVLDEKKKTIKTIRLADIKALFDKSVISGGMIPKIKACSQAVRKGVKEVWIADGSKGLSKIDGTVIKR
ncbi:MAG: acetylglutamate kinase [Elusimicrobia bacterium]|nr:acetylglutamate kinase [Elusimicrobiota bacterium]